MLLLLLACGEPPSTDTAQTPAVHLGSCPADDFIGALGFAEQAPGQQVLSGYLTDKPIRFNQWIGEGDCRQIVQRPQDPSCGEDSYNPTGFGCESLPQYRSDYVVEVTVDGSSTTLSPDSPENDFYLQGSTEFSLSVDLDGVRYPSPILSPPTTVSVQGSDDAAFGADGTLEVTWAGGREGQLIALTSAGYPVTSAGQSTIASTSCISWAPDGTWQLPPELNQEMQWATVSHGVLYHAFTPDGACLELYYMRYEGLQIAYAE